jgi:DNA invertase Pin-like site-specific DNA recombinase
MSDGLRLLAYGRVSDVRGREGPGFISPSEQMSRIRSYADAYGHKIVEEGIDLDRSGGDMSRPIFDGFLERIGRGDADGLIVAKLDRFARSNLGALQAIESIEGAGGILISVQEQIDPRSASGRFMRSIFLATAQMERERIGEQWHVARSSAVGRGIHVSHHVPPGYVRAPKSSDAKTDRRLSPHRKHARTIRTAFTMAAAGTSDAEIAAYLNQRALPVTSVKEGDKETFWQSSRVKRLLASRVYLGEASSGNGIVNPDAHEALVDETTFTLAQSHRAPSRSVSNGAGALLAGLCRCASCSFAMKSQQARGTAPGIYRCSTTSVHGRCAAPSSISKDRFERYVLDEFLASMKAMTLEVEEAESPDLRELVAASSEAERSYRAQLTNLELRRRIGDADHDDLIAALHREWTEREDALAVVRQSRPAQVDVDGVTLPELVDRLLAEGDVARLRSLLESHIEAVFVRPAAGRSKTLPVADRVRIVFRGDEKLELPRRGGRRFTPRAYTWT